MRLKIFFITFLVLLIGAMAYLKANKFVNLDPREEKLFSDYAIIETKEIKIPGFPAAYNPSIIPYKKGYLLSFRVNSYNGSTFVKKLFNHRTSFLGLVQLDEKFNPINKAQLIAVPTDDPTKISAPQDARLFLANGVIYIFFNDYAKPDARSQELFVGELTNVDGRFCFLNNPKQLCYAGSMQKVEKNWSPFLYKDKLCVSYSAIPHVILEINHTTGIASKIEASASSIDWNFGPVRGGTPSLPIDGGYLTFFHSCKLGVPSMLSKKNGRVYYMGAYFFAAKPPFAIKKMTPVPLAHVDDYKFNNPKKIVYPGGIALDGVEIHVVWGRNDSRICVSTFDKNKLFSTMINCESL